MSSWFSHRSQRYSRTPQSLAQTKKLSLRNKERLQLLKWGQKAFQNMRIVPPSNVIVHQDNLEYFTRSVFDNNGWLLSRDWQSYYYDQWTWSIRIKDFKFTPGSIPNIQDAYNLPTGWFSHYWSYLTCWQDFLKKFCSQIPQESKDLNSYGARRSNYEIIPRGTFANIRLINELVGHTGPKTVHFPTQQELYIYNVADKYMSLGHKLISIAGKEYGSGSSRDRAAKGSLIQGIKAVIAERYERIHRSNLVFIGILPMQYKVGQ